MDFLVNYHIQNIENIIKTYQPDYFYNLAAISLVPESFKIPQKILEIEPDYDVYLRHYMEGIFESVMYFIPKA